MIKYRVIIEKITAEPIVKKEYQRFHNKEIFDSKEDPQFGYISIEKVEDITEEIYRQTVEFDIDMKRVIDSFNAGVTKS